MHRYAVRSAQSSRSAPAGQPGRQDRTVPAFPWGEHVRLTVQVDPAALRQLAGHVGGQSSVPFEIRGHTQVWPGRREGGKQAVCALHFPLSPPGGHPWVSRPGQGGDRSLPGRGSGGFLPGATRGASSSVQHRLPRCRRPAPVASPGAWRFACFDMSCSPSSCSSRPRRTLSTMAARPARRVPSSP